MKSFKLTSILAIALMGLCIGCAEPTTEPVAEATDAVTTAPAETETVAATPKVDDTTGCASCKTEDKCDGCKEATATAAPAAPCCKGDAKPCCKDGDAPAAGEDCKKCDKDVKAEDAS